MKTLADEEVVSFGSGSVEEVVSRQRKAKWSGKYRALVKDMKPILRCRYQGSTDGPEDCAGELKLRVNARKRRK